MDLDKLILTVICIDQWDGKRKSCKGGRWEKKSHILTSCCSFSVAEHLITCMWWLLLMKHIRTQHPDRKPFTWQRIHNKKITNQITLFAMLMTLLWLDEKMVCHQASNTEKLWLHLIVSNYVVTVPLLQYKTCFILIQTFASQLIMFWWWNNYFPLKCWWISDRRNAAFHFFQTSIQWSIVFITQIAAQRQFFFIHRLLSTTDTDYSSKVDYDHVVVLQRMTSSCSQGINVGWMNE